MGIYLSQKLLNQLGALDYLASTLPPKYQADFTNELGKLRQIITEPTTNSWSKVQRASHGERISNIWKAKRDRQRFLLLTADSWFYLASWEEASRAWNNVNESSLRVAFSKARCMRITGFLKGRQENASLLRLPLDFPYLTVEDFKEALVKKETSIAEWLEKAGVPAAVEPPTKKARAADDPDSESFRPPVRRRQQ